MSTATVKKEAELGAEAPSRLDMVRAGNVGTFAGRIPQRGRILVDIDAIIPDPRNERKSFNNIEQLAESIKAVGIIEAPTVVPASENGKYLLTTGERRWRAAKLAGLKQVHVIIGDSEQEQKRRLKSLISNIQRDNLGAIELAQALQAMKDDQSISTNRALATLIGKSEQWVSGMFKILELPRKIQETIAHSDQPISYDTAQQIARLDDETQQNELLKHALSGTTTRNIRDKARELKGNQSKASAKPQASQRKIPWGKGNWVIVHKSETEGEELSRADCRKALKDALAKLETLEF